MASLPLEIEISHAGDLFSRLGEYPQTPHAPPARPAGGGFWGVEKLKVLYLLKFNTPKNTTFVR